MSQVETTRPARSTQTRKERVETFLKGFEWTWATAVVFSLGLVFFLLISTSVLPSFWLYFSEQTLGWQGPTDIEAALLEVPTLPPGGDPAEYQELLLQIRDAVAMGLFGLGLGGVLRHTAVAITVFVAVLLILPAMLGPALPEDLEKKVIPYVPIAAAQAIYTQVRDAAGPFTLLSPWSGLLVLAGWVITLLVAGIVVLNRRDA